MSLGDWAKNNVVALATWLGVALSLVATSAANVAISQDTQSELVETVAQHEEDIVSLESEVRSIREQQARLVKVAEKTESVLSELDKTTAELKVMVQAMRQ
tara:strand:- start:523 stop:825 length:303 start_codon:yes stop_codon:yes gene_type:complete